MSRERAIRSFLKLNSKRFIREELPGGGGGDTGGLSLQVEEKPEEEESTGSLVVNIKKPEPTRPAPLAPLKPPPAVRPPPMELSLEEKYKKLNYAEYSAIESNTIKQASLIALLISKYPEFKTLSDTESKKLVMLSKKYYRKQTK